MGLRKRFLLFQWALFLGLTELFLIFFSSFGGLVFLLIGIGFLVGFFLRVYHIYPGKPEPLSLDLSASLIALFGALIFFLYPTKALTMILPFLILSTHIIYIIRKGNPT